MVDAACEEAGAESVVDVDYADSGGARVEHGEKGDRSAEGRAVSDARRNRDHRRLDESADHARERSLHSRDRDHHARGAELVRAGEEPVEPRDTDVVQAHHLVAQGLRDERGLFRDRNVARPSGRDGDGADAVARPVSAEASEARLGEVREVVAEGLRDGLRLFGVDARDEGGELSVVPE